MATTKKVQLKLHNRRALQVMDYVKSQKLRNVTNDKEFMQSINYSAPSNITKIKAGQLSFTAEQLGELMNTYDVDANFFFYKDHLQMFKKQTKMTTLPALLREALRLAEAK